MKIEIKCPDCNDLLEIEINELFEIISVTKTKSVCNETTVYKNIEFGIIE